MSGDTRPAWDDSEARRSLTRVLVAANVSAHQEAQLLAAFAAAVEAAVRADIKAQGEAGCEKYGHEVMDICARCGQSAHDIYAPARDGSTPK